MPRDGRLTYAEFLIVGLVVEGLTNKEIAKRMGVSEKTIKNRLRIIFKKLNIKSRYELYPD